MHSTPSGSTNGHANGYIDEDVDDERPVAKQPAPDADTVVKKNGDVSANVSADSTQSESLTDDQEFIFIHEDAFNVKINAPRLDPFEIQVSFESALSSSNRTQFRF
jgi:hypothetical protein